MGPGVGPALHAVGPWAVLRGLCSLLKMYLIRKVQRPAVRAQRGGGGGGASSGLMPLVALGEGRAGERGPRPEAPEGR